MNRLTTVFHYRSLASIIPLLAVFGSIPAAAAAPADDPSVAAQAYLDEWNARGAPACEAKSEDCPKFAESLFNAAEAFQRAGDRNKAIMARKLLLFPKYHLESTELARKAAFQLAEDYKAIAEYAQSAELLESAATKWSNDAGAPDALTDATIFRIALGEFDKAQRNVELFDKMYGAKKPAMAMTMWMALAATFVEREQFKEAKPILEKIIPRADKDGETRDKFVVRSLLAQTLMRLDDAKGAEREYAAVLASWRNTEVQKGVFADGKGNPRDVAKVLTVVGEAMFFFAEQKRKDAEAIRYPEFKGPADKDAVLKHINTKVVDWIKKKRPAIEEAEKAYQQIVNLQPAPPPRWVVASAARVGKMWGSFVAEFRSAPIPKEWKSHGVIPGTDLTYDELRKEYYAKIDEAVEPQKQQAKAAFKVCVDYSVKFQAVDEQTQSCQKWLERHYRTEFVHVDEFIPSYHMPSTTLSPAAILPDPRAKP